MFKHIGVFLSVKGDLFLNFWIFFGLLQKKNGMFFFGHLGDDAVLVAVPSLECLHNLVFLVFDIFGSTDGLDTLAVLKGSDLSSAEGEMKGELGCW